MNQYNKPSQKSPYTDSSYQSKKIKKKGCGCGNKEKASIAYSKETGELRFLFF